jgi:hypothetical protein
MFAVPVSTIDRCDRWQVSQRLQELNIASYCLPDGQLSIDIQHPIDIVQLRSVIQQSTASRADLLDWLERCWQIQDRSTPNH